MRLWQGLFGVVVMAIAGQASAQICASLPYTLTNGAPADATQVMANFNCLALQGAGHFTGTTTFSSNYGGAFPNFGQAQGLAIGWNGGAGTNGETDFINFPGTGGGGFSFVFANKNGVVTGTPLVITGAGNVGIGVTNPYYNLTVMSLNTAYSQAIAIDTPTTAEQSGIALNSHGAVKWVIGKNTDDSFFLYDPVRNLSDIYVYSNGNMLLMPAGGSVGVGGPPSAGTFYVNGSTVLTQGYSTTSDGRLKKDVRPILDALDLVERLQGVRYNWRPAAERPVGKDLKLPLDEPQIGFIAQDVQAVAPEAVVAPKPGSSEIYSLKEDKLIPLLVEAIKAQQAEIALLKSQVEAQQKQLNQLSTGSSTPAAEK